MGYNLSKYAEGYQLTKQDERDQEIILATSLAYCRFSQALSNTGTGRAVYLERGNHLRGVQLANPKAASRIKTRVKAAANRAAVAAIRANSSRNPAAAASRIVRDRAASRVAAGRIKTANGVSLIDRSCGMPRLLPGHFLLVTGWAASANSQPCDLRPCGLRRSTTSCLPPFPH
jgi:hypothetical protein